MGDAIKALDKTWAIDGVLHFKLGKGDMPIIEICNDLGEATVALQGAHVMHFCPKGEKPVIWMSEDAKFAAGKSLRGGAPICWPWFGPHESNASLPAHGPARTLDWQVEATAQLPDGRTSISLQLPQNKAWENIFPQSLRVRLDIVVGTSLELALHTHNQGSETYTLGQALHTYFCVGDVRNTRVEGLDGCEYLDKVDGFARKKQQGDVLIEQETDRVYVQTPNTLRLLDASLKRAIVIRNQGSASAIVWNPWQATADKMGDLGQDGYLQMLCVETANAQDDVVQLESGQSHCMMATYHVEIL